MTTVAIVLVLSLVTALVSTLLFNSINENYNSETNKNECTIADYSMFAYDVLATKAN